MTDRFPLIVDSTTGTVKELPSGDNLNLSGSNIINADFSGETSFDGSTSTDLVRITQTGSGNVLLVEDTANPDSSPLIITGIGSVGVGTTTPSAKVHILTEDIQPGLRIVQSNPTTSNFPFIVSRSDREAPLFRISGIGSIGIGTTSASDFMIFKNFDNGVGAGATQGLGKLSFFCGAPNNLAIATVGSASTGAFNWSPGWAVTQLTIDAFGTTDVGIATTATEYFNHNVVLSFGNQDPRTLIKQHSANAHIVLSTNEVANGNFGGGKLDFYVRGNTGPYTFPHNPFVPPEYNMTSLLSIDGVSQNVGIGSSLPAKKLNLNGSFRFTSRGAPSTQTALHINTTTGDVVETASSRRFKKDIEDYDKGLETVLQLRPVLFKFIEEERVNAGLIAEEVADLGLEEFVLREEDGTPRSIPYDNLSALFVKAIQELKAENDTLRSELDGIKEHLSL